MVNEHAFEQKISTVDQLIDALLRQHNHLVQENQYLRQKVAQQNQHLEKLKSRHHLAAERVKQIMQQIRHALA